MSGVPAGKACAACGGSVVVAVVVAAVAVAAADRHPEIGSLVGGPGDAWSGHPGVAVEFPAYAAGSATTVHAGDRYEYELELVEAKRGSMEIPHFHVAVMAVHIGKGKASVMDLGSSCGLQVDMSVWLGHWGPVPMERSAHVDACNCHKAHCSDVHC